MQLMEMLEDDTSVDNLDHQSILMEARFRLSQMIDDHVGNSDAQNKLLDSLKYWFHNLQQDSQQELEGEIANLKDKDTEDVTKIAALINHVFEKNESSLDSASTLHHTITSSFQKTIREFKKQIEMRDLEISRLHKQIESQVKGRRRPNALSKKSINGSVKDTDNIISTAQRRICEQEVQISNLKNAISTARTQESNESAKTSAIDLPEVNVEKELEYDTKIKILMEQINMLKQEVSSTQSQLKQSKLSEISLDNKIQSLERLRKNLEQSLENQRDKFNTMEATYKKKLEEPQEKSQQSDESRALVDLRATYEKRITEIKEIAASQQSKALEQVEKRNRAQISDLLKSLESGDQSKTLQEIIKQQEEKSNEIRKMYLEQINSLKQTNAERIQTLTRQYESKLKNASQKEQVMKEAAQVDIDSILMQQKLDLEDGFRKQISEMQDEADARYSEMKSKLDIKIDTLESKLKRTVNEKNSLRSIIEKSESITLPDQEEEEEIYEQEPITSSRHIDEDYVNEKVYEAKKQVEEFYNMKLSQQKEQLERAKIWELEQLQNNLQSTYERNLAELRTKTFSDLEALRDKLRQAQSSSENSTSIHDDIDEMINGMADTINSTPPESMETMVPLSKVQAQIDELNNALIEANSDREFMKRALDKLSVRAGGEALKASENDIMNAMRQSVADQASQLNEILKENEELRKQKLELEKQIQPRPKVYLGLERTALQVHIGEKKEVNIVPVPSLSSHNSSRPQNNEQYPNYDKEVYDDEETILHSTPREKISVALIQIGCQTDFTSFTKLNTSQALLEIDKPQATVVCQKCGHELDVDKDVLQVSTVVPPVVECEHCHNTVNLKDKLDEDTPFPPESFSKDDLDHISQKEAEIQQGIVDLIELKNQMRNENTSQPEGDINVTINQGDKIVIQINNDRLPPLQDNQETPELHVEMPNPDAQTDNSEQLQLIPQKVLDQTNPTQQGENKTSQSEVSSRTQSNPSTPQTPQTSITPQTHISPENSEDTKSSVDSTLQQGTVKQKSPIVSSRSFTDLSKDDKFTDAQVQIIAQKEKEINDQINQLLQFKLNKSNNTVSMPKGKLPNLPVTEENKRPLTQPGSAKKGVPIKPKASFPGRSTDTQEIFCIKPGDLNLEDAKGEIDFLNSKIIDLEKKLKEARNFQKSNSMQKNRVSFQLGCVQPPRRRMSTNSRDPTDDILANTISLKSSAYKKGSGPTILPIDEKYDVLKDQAPGLQSGYQSSQVQHGLPPRGNSTTPEEQQVSIQKAHQVQLGFPPSPSDAQGTQAQNNEEPKLVSLAQAHKVTIPISLVGPTLGQENSGNASMPQQVQSGLPPSGVQSGFPPSGVQSGFPPSGVQSGFPPSGVQSGFPPRSVQQGLPPREVQSGFPPQEVQSGLPPRDGQLGFTPAPVQQGLPPLFPGEISRGLPPGTVNQGFPSQQVQQGFPSQEVQPGFPPQSDQQGFTMNIHMGLPPKEFIQGFPTQEVQSGFPAPVQSGFPPPSQPGMSSSEQQARTSTGTLPLSKVNNIQIAFPKSHSISEMPISNQLTLQLNTSTISHSTEQLSLQPIIETLNQEVQVDLVSTQSQRSPEISMEIVQTQPAIDQAYSVQELQEKSKTPPPLNTPPDEGHKTQMVKSANIQDELLQVNQEVNPEVMDRIQHQVDRNQRLEELKSQIQNGPKTFLTPEADLLGLQLSDVHAFSKRNSGILSPNVGEDGDIGNEYCPDALTFNKSKVPTAPKTKEEVIVKKRIEIVGEPRAVEEVKEDLKEWTGKMEILKENTRSIRSMYDEIKESYKSLQVRHKEIVEALTHALNTAYGLAKGTEHPEALIERMQEQSAYLTSVIREKETMHTVSDETNQLLAEKSQEVISLQEDISVKSSKVSFLNDKVNQLLADIKNEKTHKNILEMENKALSTTSEAQKNQIDNIYKELSKLNEQNHIKDNTIQELRDKITFLENQLLLEENPNPDMIFIDPFEIFSTFSDVGNFGIDPNPISTDENVPQPITENQEEVIRVSYNRTSIPSLKKPLSPLPPPNSTEKSEKNTSSSRKLQFTKFHANSHSQQGQQSATQSISFSSRSSNMQSGVSTSENTAMSSSKHAGEFFNVKPISGRTIANQTTTNMKKRIQQMEQNVVQKSKELIEMKEQLHQSQQQLFKITNEQQKYIRDNQKLTQLNESSSIKLNSALEIISTLSRENDNLKRTINELSKAAKEIQKHTKLQDQLENEKALATMSETKNRQLLHDLQAYGNSQEMKNLAIRHALAISKWENRRQALLKKEQDHTYAVLQAMKLISDSPIVQGRKTPSDELKPLETHGFQITNLSKDNDEKDKQKKESLYSSKDIKIVQEAGMPTYEEALKVANAHQQKLPKQLKAGVVANPIKL